MPLDVPKGVGRIPGAAACVFHVPGLCRIHVRQQGGSVREADIADEYHAVGAVRGIIRADFTGRNFAGNNHVRGLFDNRIVCLGRAGDRWFNQVGEIFGEVFIRDFLCCSIFCHFTHHIIQLRNEGRTLLRAVSVFFIHDVALNDGDGRIIFEFGTVSIVINQDNINFPVFQCVKGIYVFWESIQIDGRDFPAHQQVGCGPLLETGSFQNTELQRADVLFGHGLTGSGKQYAAGLVIWSGVIDSLCAFIRDGKTAADQVYLPDDDGIDKTVKSHVDRLDGHPESAAHFFDKGDVQTVQVVYVCRVHKRIIVRRDAKTDHTGAFDIFPLIRGTYNSQQAKRCKNGEQNETFL